MSKLFIHNKYRILYLQIVKKAKSENRKKLHHNHNDYVYYENHHILPKSIFPKYENLSLYFWNSVLLTAKEHYLVHKLLTKCTIGRAKEAMTSALFFITNGSKYERYIPCSLAYSLIREEFSKAQCIRHTGKIVSSETRKRMSISGKGRIVTDETKRNMPKSQKRLVEEGRSNSGKIGKENFM